MNDARHELIDYLALQFPATIGHIPLAEKIDEVRRQALLESADIINTRMSLLETWGDDETRENIHIKEIRALRPVYDAILARAKEVEDK